MHQRVNVNWVSSGKEEEPYRAQFAMPFFSTNLRFAPIIIDWFKCILSVAYVKPDRNYIRKHCKRKMFYGCVVAAENLITRFGWQSSASSSFL